MLQTVLQKTHELWTQYSSKAPSLPICISVLAFVIALKNYRRKTGVQVRGTFSTARSGACEDWYISSVTLENLKDRAVTIFAIYLRLGYNYYLELKSFAESPLLLKGYESYHCEFGPLELYQSNGRRINLNALLDFHQRHQRLVLSTSDGKYVVPRLIRRWSPITDYFKNHFTHVVRPARTLYHGEAIGGRIKYVVGITLEDGDEKVMQIHEDGSSGFRFDEFKIPAEAHADKDTLTTFLEEQRLAGKWTCKRFTVFDMEAQRKRGHQFGPAIRAEYINAFYYHALGRLVTIWQDRQLRQKNAIQSKRTTTQEAPKLPEGFEQPATGGEFESHGQE